ncbi:PEP-CTERM sorting domain-containing protein [Rariglobus hedericola]|uniref:PEP-CTERM sorting domain-containing protein n=1 Tax=Rariglobus hedericola TaxID=2597822 RepID=A0A556QRK3_9BACT|nr:PEP-CTERM sorting domain-containing protein [Rariglobus hedericola]TSJ79277.1 PEP-CTERM sorting domain-containing protein [Rariglobus hedericola]
MKALNTPLISSVAFVLPAIAMSLALLVTPSAQATDYTYTATGVTNWSAGAWTSATPSSSLDNELFFTAATGQRMVTTNNLGAGFQLNKLSINNTSSNSNGQNFSVAGNSLDFVKNSSNALPTIVLAKSNNSAGTTTISVAFTVTDALTVTSTVNTSSPNANSTIISSIITNNAGITFNGAGTNTITLGNTGTGIVSGLGGITVSGSYNVNMLGNNSYTGATTVSSGTLTLGNNNRIADASNLVMSGGTFATAGFSETLGTLSVLTAASVIDLGSAASALVFSDSSGVAWDPSIGLSFINFDAGVDSIKIGTNSNGLTVTQLGQITINGLAATIDSNGFLAISAIPEPTTYAAFVGALSLGWVAARRKRRAYAV